MKTESQILDKFIEVNEVIEGITNSIETTGESSFEEIALRDDKKIEARLLRWILDGKEIPA